MVLNGMKMFSLSGGESNKLFQNKMLGKFYQLIEFSFLQKNDEHLFNVIEFTMNLYIFWVL